MSDSHIVAIDLGSSSIKMAIAKYMENTEQPKVQVLALVKRNSNGIKKGIISNMSEATETIQDAVEQAEGILGVPVDSGVIGLGGNSINFVSSQGLIIVSRQDNEITEYDVDRVLQDSLNKSYITPGTEILHTIPKSFTVDSQSGIKYPVGMIGSKMECQTLIISCEQSYLKNFSKVFNQAGVDVEDRFFMPLSSSEFVLNSRQKKAGSVLIDMGATSTSFIVWENEEILGTGVVPVGSDHITADIAVGLQINIDLAEKIKKEYLNFSSDMDLEEEIQIYNSDLEVNEVFKIKEIKYYSRPRIEEIFQMVSREIKKIPKTTQLPGGAILIGGSSSLGGITDIARQILRMPIFRNNFDQETIDFVPDYDGDPSFVNAISLAAYFLFHEGESPESKSGKKAKETFESKNNPFGWIKKILPF